MTTNYNKLDILIESLDSKRRLTMLCILTDIPIGRNIQTIRMKRNMTQLQVVAQMQLNGSNMSRSTLANIETERRNIKASDLKLLKMIFDVDYEEFFKE